MKPGQRLLALVLAVTAATACERKGFDRMNLLVESVGRLASAYRPQHLLASNRAPCS
jgi:hypothetical protein